MIIKINSYLIDMLKDIQVNNFESLREKQIYIHWKHV